MDLELRGKPRKVRHILRIKGRNSPNNIFLATSLPGLPDLGSSLPLISPPFSTLISYQKPVNYCDFFFFFQKQSFAIFTTNALVTWPLLPPVNQPAGVDVISVSCIYWLWAQLQESLRIRRNMIKLSLTVHTRTHTDTPILLTKVCENR